MTAEPNHRQQKLLSELTQRSTPHAGLYAFVLRELGSEAIEETRSARISVICHCARELMLGALDILVDTPEPRPNPSSGSLTKSLTSVLAANGSPDLRVDQDLIPLPKAVATAIADLVDASTREIGRNRRNAAALVTGNAEDSHSSVAEWSNTYSFFVKWAHVDQHHSGALPDDRLLASHLQVVEDVIEVRMSQFFDNLSAVEDLLAAANRTDDESS